MSWAVVLLVACGPGAADEGTWRLDAFRERLESFQTVFVRVSLRPQRGSPLHAEAVTTVLRIERHTGRWTYDTSRRVSWDGQHLWRDTSTAAKAVRVGDDADGMVADFMTELLGGLAKTRIVGTLGEYWGPGQGFTRIDLPFSWDDPYAILLSEDRGGGVRSISVLARDTRDPIHLFGVELNRVPLTFDWDVRLFDDLGEPEDVGSRSFVVSDDGWTQEWDGPPFLPGWHRDTTHNPMIFDVAASRGVAPSGVDIPWANLYDVACASVGQTVSLPVQLTYGIDVTHDSFAFLPDALAAGCPLNVDFGMTTDHRPAAGVETRVQVVARLVDRSTRLGGPVSLAQSDMEESKSAPCYPRYGHDVTLTTTGAAIEEPEFLQLWVEGSVTVVCTTAHSESSQVGVGLSIDDPPVLSWPDCYPELGRVPALLDRDELRRPRWQ